MIDRKTIRQQIGYTQAAQTANVASWHRSALSFHRAAKVLYQNSNQIPQDTRPFSFNAALSLELVLKCILAKKKITIPSGPNGHNLQILSEKANVTITDKQKMTLEILTEILIWAGRYPAPKTPEAWDRYQDEILESHVVQNKSGNVYSALADRETFPTWENYERIWNCCLGELTAQKQDQHR
jgi:hypothetical protein